MLAATWDLESRNIIRPLNEFHEQARAAVPCDVAVEGPGARVVGVALQYDVAKGGDHLPRVHGVGDCVVPMAGADGEDLGVALFIFLDQEDSR